MCQGEGQDSFQGSMNERHAYENMDALHECHERVVVVALG